MLLKYRMIECAGYSGRTWSTRLRCSDSSGRSWCATEDLRQGIDSRSVAQDHCDYSVKNGSNQGEL